jgi:hypothetical protein
VEVVHVLAARTLVDCRVELEADQVLPCRQMDLEGAVPTDDHSVLKAFRKPKVDEPRRPGVQPSRTEGKGQADLFDGGRKERGEGLRLGVPGRPGEAHDIEVGGGRSMKPRSRRLPPPITSTPTLWPRSASVSNASAVGPVP